MDRISWVVDDVTHLYAIKKLRRAGKVALGRMGSVERLLVRKGNANSMVGINTIVTTECLGHLWFQIVLGVKRICRCQPSPRDAGNLVRMPKGEKRYSFADVQLLRTKSAQEMWRGILSSTELRYSQPDRKI
jgi:hypothetical protein